VICQRCGETLPADCPPEWRTCKEYSDNAAREYGGMLPEQLAQELTLYKIYCGMLVAFDRGDKEIEV
jgi:hypothetical protein